MHTDSDNDGPSDISMGRLLPFFVALLAASWSPSAAADASSQSTAAGVREPRGIIKDRLCKRYGICGGGYQGGNQGGHSGNNNYQGGYQTGYQPGYGGVPAINIGISQSQSSSSAGGGGYSMGYYPNYNQYNQGYGGKPIQGGYPGGYPHQGYQKPGYFGNGHGSHNSQFNGNYYGPTLAGGLGPNGGGYGFVPGQFGFNDEASNDEGHRPDHHEDNNYYNNNYNDENGAEAFSGAYAYSRSNKKT